MREIDGLLAGALPKAQDDKAFYFPKDFFGLIDFIFGNDIAGCRPNRS
jgi:hypothetical protein